MEIKESGIKFEIFLRTCSVFSRESLEEQLPFLFRAMKDPKEEFVTINSAVEFAKLIKNSFQSKKKSRSGDILGKMLENVDLVNEIKTKLFDQNHNKLSLKNFVIKAISTPISLKCLSILERFFHPVIIEMERDIETNLNCLSLRYLLRLG